MKKSREDNYPRFKKYLKASNIFIPLTNIFKSDNGNIS